MTSDAEVGTADCCASPADPRIARTFDRRTRERLASGGLPELHDVSRRVRDMLADVSGIQPTVLELGCGSGALTVDLVRAGASRATGIDLSVASVEAARARALEAGVADRTTFEVGDGASIALLAHDWVVLDRVLCCYRDVDRLLEASAGASRRRYAFSVPVSWGWRGAAKRLMLRLEAVTSGLRGRPCPGYVHDVRQIEGRLAAAGFAPLRRSAVGMWYVAVFERPSGP